jgi:hypothetical protein
MQVLEILSHPASEILKRSTSGVAYLAARAAKESDGQKSRTASPTRVPMPNTEAGPSSHIPVPGGSSQSRSRNASPSRSSSRSRAAGRAEAALPLGNRAVGAGEQVEKSAKSGLGMKPAMKELQEQHLGVSSGEAWISFSGGGAPPGTGITGASKSPTPQVQQQQSSSPSRPRMAGQGPAAASSTGVTIGESLDFKWCNGWC